MGAERFCACCKKPIIGKPTKRFCSNKCRSKKWVELHPNEKKSYQRKYYSKNIGMIKERNKCRDRTGFYGETDRLRSVKWRSLNKELCNKRVKSSLQKARYELKDSYLKDLFKSIQIDIPSKELIEIKREQIKLLRKIKQHEKERSAPNINRTPGLD